MTGAHFVDGSSKVFFFSRSFFLRLGEIQLVGAEIRERVGLFVLSQLKHNSSAAILGCIGTTVWFY